MDSGLPVTNDDGTYTLGYDYGKQKIAKSTYTPNRLDMKYIKDGNCIAVVVWFQQ